MGRALIGAAGVCIASLFWGSNFIVCRGYDLPPDGMHFVFLMSTGILLVGLLTLFSSATEDGDFEAVFSPDGIAGGAIWAVGNFLTVPIVQNAGLGVGFSTWAGVNLIVSFIVGAVGLGSILPREQLARPAVGVIGIVLAIAALALFARVRPRLSTVDNDGGEDGTLGEPLLPPRDAAEQDYGSSTGTTSSGSILLAIDELQHPDLEANSGCRQREEGNVPFGITMAIVAGILYGFQFVPLSSWNNKIDKLGRIFDHERPPDVVRAFRFFFSQFAGIFLTSLLGFTAYCLWNGNKPHLVPSEATLPSIVSGVVWAVGCAGGMLATSGLGNAVGFPLLLNGAFLVNSSWSIFHFKEIQGRRNLWLFGGALGINMVSSILIAISKG